MVLLVDDEVFVLELMKRKLLIENYSVKTARSVDEAIELMKTFDEIKVLVTDLHLPDGSGMALLEWTAANKPDIKRVVLSAHTYEDWVKSDEKALCDHILTKPIDVEAVLVPLLKKMMP